VRNFDPKPETLEKADVKLGYIPLTDCVPLVIAKELGFFSKMGLNVELKPQMGWATLRDRVLAGDLDGAQMLSPLLIASNMRLDHSAYRLVTGLTLSRNGNAITMSERVVQELENIRGAKVNIPFSGADLIPLLESRDTPLVFASVHPHSSHELLLRHWLRSLPDTLKDKWRIIVIPPVKMVEAMTQGQIDGYCVGGPWNADAVRRKLGVTVATSIDLLPDHAEKVLGVRAEWHEAYKNTHLALIRALVEALAWLDSIPNRFEAARILWSKAYVDAPLDVIAPSLLDSCLVRHDAYPRKVTGYNRFFGIDCNVPSVADGMHLSQLLYSHGLIKEVPEQEVIAQTYLESTFAEAMGSRFFSQ